MKDKGLTFLIIGAGASGLAFALEAASQGLACRIIDKRLKRSQIGKATGISLSALHMLKQYGVDPSVCEGAIPMQNFTFYDNKKLVTHLNIPLINKEPPAHLFPQGELENLMESQLNQQGVFVEYGKAFVDTESINDQCSTRIYSEIQQENECIASQWLIGADGAHSHVRQAVNVPFTGKNYNETWSVAEIDTHQWQAESQGNTDVQEHKQGSAQAQLFLTSAGVGLFLSKPKASRVQAIINAPYVEAAIQEHFTDYRLIYKREFSVALKRVLTPKIGNVWSIEIMT